MKHENASEALKAWDSGEITWTIEMGGIGPGYEQVIQVMMFEFLRYMLENLIDKERLDSDKEYWPKYREQMEGELFAKDSICSKINPSGAQVGAAQSLASGFAIKGYQPTLDSVDRDRRILVSKNFPG